MTILRFGRFRRSKRRRRAIPVRPHPPVAPAVVRRDGATVLRARAERRRLMVRRVLHAIFALVGLATMALVARDYAGWRSGGDAFRVKEVSIRGASRVNPQEIPALQAIGPGTTIFDFDAASLSEAVSRHPWVRRAEVTRTLPDKIEVVITERQPVGIVLSGDLLVQIDIEGVLLPTRDGGVAEDLPMITGIELPHPIPFGTRDSTTAWGQAAAFLGGLEALKSTGGEPVLGISELHVDTNANEYLVMEEGGRCLRFPAVGVGATLPDLFGVLGELASANLVADYVDLRFRGQVVVGGARPREVEAVCDSIAAARTAAKAAAAPEGERAG